MSLPRSEVFDLTAEMVSLGFLAFPVAPNDKVPLTKNGFLNASADLARINTWVHNKGHPNVGIVYPIDALPLVFILDVDGGHGEKKWQTKWKELEERLGKLPRTRITKTPSGGRHIYLVWDTTRDGPPPTGGRFLGFTVRWPAAGYVLGPGSEIDGKVYESNRAPIAVLPEAWAQAALAEGRVIRVTESSNAMELPASVAEGARYDAIRTLVAGYYNREIPKETIWTVVLHDLAPRFEVPLSEPELRDRFERTYDHIGERLGPPRAGPAVRAEREAQREVAQTLDDIIFDDLPTGAFPADPDPVAFGGLAGELVANLEPQTSASRAGLLTSILTVAGTVLATTTEFYGEQTSSFMACLVGDTARGRKSTAMTAAWRALTGEAAFGPQLGLRLNGVGSGEGIIRTAVERVKRDGFARLLVVEAEFGTVLTVNKREGSTLPFVLRTAFDREPLMNVTAARGAVGVESMQYQLGLLAGITPGELRKLLGESDLINGFANRILWVPVVGRDEDVDGRSLTVHPALALQLAVALRDAEANKHRPFALADDALEALRAYYAALVAFNSPLAMRLATIACRIALVHTSLDQDDDVITLEAVARAIALTEYSRAGFGWVFGSMVVGVDARRLLQTLMAVGEPMTKTVLGKTAFGHNRYDAGRVQDAIDALRGAGFVEVRAKPTDAKVGGRPGQVVGLLPAAGFVARFLPPFESRSAEGAPARARAREHRQEEEVMETTNGVETGPKPQSELKSEGHNPPTNPPTNLVTNDLYEGPKPQATTGEWRYPCHFYEDHRFQHHLVDGLWECPICRPGVSS